MMIGLPKALLYYRYQDLWETFFKELHCDIITSGETNKKILADGINLSIDECCLPCKIYIGHVRSLIGKCDRILVPRIVDYGVNNLVCVKFNALYDIVRNTFADIPLLDYNIDVIHGASEQAGFLKMGRALGKGYLESLLAYKKAKNSSLANNKQKADQQVELLKSRVKPKILVVSHPYNIYDRLLGYPIVESIKKLGGIPVYAHETDHTASLSRAKEMSASLYWLYNKELLGSIKLLEDKVDGIILLTAFPCGPDSLVNELILRKSKKVPTINIILDELQGEAGLQTRIESFMDIITERAKESKLWAK